MFKDYFKSLIEEFIQDANKGRYFGSSDSYTLSCHIDFFFKPENFEFVSVTIHLNEYVNIWNMLSQFRSFIKEKGLFKAYASHLQHPCRGCINVCQIQSGSFESKEFCFEAIKDDWDLFEISPDVSIISSVSNTMEE